MYPSSSPFQFTFCLGKKYDILGVDLDDDEVSGPDSTEDKNGEGTTEPQTTSQGIVQEIASMALTSVLQLGVRTGTFFQFKKIRSV